MHHHPHNMCKKQKLKVRCNICSYKYRAFWSTFPFPPWAPVYISSRLTLVKFNFKKTSGLNKSTLPSKRDKLLFFSKIQSILTSIHKQYCILFMKMPRRTHIFQEMHLHTNKASHCKVEKERKERGEKNSFPQQKMFSTAIYAGVPVSMAFCFVALPEVFLTL